MAEKRTRPSGSAPEMPPSRNMGVGNASCGGRHGDADSLSSIVSAGARKEKLRQRDFASPAARRAKVGAEVTLTPSPPSPSPSPPAGGRGEKARRGEASHLTLLVESRAGYRN